MIPWPLILLVFGLVLFVLAGLLDFRKPEPSPVRYSLVSFGLACCTMAEIIARATH